MSDPEYIKALAVAGIFYLPLSTGQSAPMSKTLWLIGKDLAGVPLVMQARKNKGVGAPIFTMSATVEINEQRTWTSLVEDAIIAYVPHGLAEDDTVAVMGIRVEATQEAVSAAYTAANPALGKLAYMDWEMLATGDDPHVVAAGPLTITPGVVA